MKLYLKCVSFATFQGSFIYIIVLIHHFFLNIHFNLNPWHVEYSMSFVISVSYRASVMGLVCTSGIAVISIVVKLGNIRCRRFVTIQKNGYCYCCYCCRVGQFLLPALRNDAGELPLNSWSPKLHSHSLLCPALPHVIDASPSRIHVTTSFYLLAYVGLIFSKKCYFYLLARCG